MKMFDGLKTTPFTYIRSRYFLWGLFIAYFISELTYGILKGNFKGDLILKADALFYRTSAWNMCRGLGFTFNGIIPDGTYQIGYPLLLSVIFKIFGNSTAPVFIIQYLLGALSCIIFFKILLMLTRHTVSIVAGLFLYISNHVIFYYSSFIVAEAFGIFLFLSFVYVSTRYFTSRNKIYIYLSGIICGILILTKNIFLLLPASILICTFFLKRDFMKEALLVFLISALIIAPYVIRNKIIFNRFSLNLYETKLLCWGMKCKPGATTLVNSRDFIVSCQKNYTRYLYLFFQDLKRHPFEKLDIYIKNFSKLNFSLDALNFGNRYSPLKRFLIFKNLIAFIATLLILFVKRQNIRQFFKIGPQFIIFLAAYYNITHSFFVSDIRYGLLSHISIYLVFAAVLDISFYIRAGVAQR